MSFLAVKKLKGKGIIEVACKHNLREIQAEIGAGSNIDHTKICLNKVLAGPCTSVEVAALATRLMAEGGIDPKALRKDAVMGLEVVVSLPGDFRGNSDGFFDDYLAWCASYFNVQVLSAVVHLDEATPHCHVILLPLSNGKMRGSALIGGRAQLLALHQSFHDKVGVHHGLPKLADTRHSAEQRRDIALDCLRALTEDITLLLEDSAVRLALVGALTKDPLLMASALGLKIPVAGQKTFAEIMTAHVSDKKEVRSKVTAQASSAGEKVKHICFDASPKPVGFDASPKHIGFARHQPENERSICSVCFASDPPILEVNPAPTKDDFARCSDPLPTIQPKLTPINEPDECTAQIDADINRVKLPFDQELWDAIWG